MTLRRHRALVVCALAASGAICALAPAVSPAHGSPRSNERPSIPGEGALEVVLRLRDLPLGYVFSGGSPLVNLSQITCDRVDPANPQPELAGFLERRSPAGCITLYRRSYRVPGGHPEPLVAGSGAMRLESAEAAHEGLAVSPLLLSHVLQDEVPEESGAPRIGDESRLFHWRHDELFSEHEESCSFLVWRSGGTLAATFVSGGPPTANDRIATELAERQQRRIEAPTPFIRADFDDTEVGLENPAIQVPVYWLGPRFGSRRGLPMVELEGSYSASRHSGSQPRVSLVYDTRNLGERGEMLLIDSYSATQWRGLASRRRRLPGVPLCDPSSARLELGHGHAVVFHGGEGWFGRCRKRGPSTWTLRERIAGLVIVAESIATCGRCAQSGTGPYDSLAGMTAIARGLERRPRSRTVR